jgi:sialic acid synthase SpsE
MARRLSFEKKILFSTLVTSFTTLETLAKIAKLCRDNGVKLMLTGVPHYPQYAPWAKARLAVLLDPASELLPAAFY